MIKSEGAVIGPGACCIVKGPKDTEWMLYHSWDSQRKYRAMSIAEVKWQGKEPVVKPTWGQPQPAPYG